MAKKPSISMEDLFRQKRHYEIGGGWSVGINEIDWQVFFGGIDANTWLGVDIKTHTTFGGAMAWIESLSEDQLNIIGG
jgi:hypothetical protein